MLIDVITIFPKMFEPVLGESIIKRARQKGLVKIRVYDLRDYSDDSHRKVDTSSYGGGGMVFKPAPLFRAAEAITGQTLFPPKKKDTTCRIILFSPQGKTLNQRLVKKFFKYQRLILLAPRYEGVDERVRKYLADEEISIGDYVLSGGELAAMVFIDCLVRLIPGVVSDRESVKNESFENSLLDFPHFTKPADFRGLKVPRVLMSGNHQAIKAWRAKQALALTRRRRPDLLAD